MEIQLLGTGGAFAKNYFNTNTLFHVQGQTMLLDCGITAPMALHQMGMSMADIDALVISHIHADHIGGIEELAYQLKYVYQKRIPIYVPAPLVDRLWDQSLRGGLAQLETDTLSTYFDVHALEVDRATTLWDGLTVRIMQTEHIPGKDSFSFVINDHLFYSADMTMNEQLLLTLEQQGCTIFMHECQFESPAPVHTSLAELLTLPESLQRKIWLMHYGDRRPQYEGAIGSLRFLEQHHRYTLSDLT